MEARGSNNRIMSNNIFMSKSTSILAVTASEGEFFSETASEFVDLLHFELGSAVDAKKVDVFDFISPTGSAGSFL